MLIALDPDAYVGTTARYTCPFHQQNPDIVSFAGCACSSSYGMRPATPEERAKNRNLRLDRERRLQEWIDNGR